MKKKFKSSFTHSSKTYKNEIDIYKKRLDTVNLTWCNQVIDLIENYNIKSIKDIGCNYFQFYVVIIFNFIKN
jgi:hypothetical protein